MSGTRLAYLILPRCAVRLAFFPGTTQTHPSTPRPFRGVLRFHLGLSVPTTEDGTPSTVLMIDDIEHRIGNGKFLLWDDTFPHEVWNHSDSMRIALLLDIRRRDMPLDLELFSSFIVKRIGTTIRLRRIF